MGSIHEKNSGQKSHSTVPLRSIERQGTTEVHLYITNTLATFQLLSSIEATFKNLAATAFYHF
jgi:hypothetical protein